MTNDYYYTQHVLIYREEEYLLVQNAIFAYLFTKNSFRRTFVTLRASHPGELNQGIFVTLRAAHLGELSQELSSIQTFVRSNKRYNIRRSHS